MRGEGGEGSGRGRGRCVCRVCLVGGAGGVLGWRGREWIWLEGEEECELASCRADIVECKQAGDTHIHVYLVA